MKVTRGQPGSPTSNCSDISIFRQMSEKRVVGVKKLTFLRRPITPTSRYSETGSVNPTSQKSDMPLFRHTVVPTSHYSDISIHRHFVNPTSPYSDSIMCNKSNRLAWRPGHFENKTWKKTKWKFLLKILNYRIDVYTKNAGIESIFETQGSTSSHV